MRSIQIMLYAFIISTGSFIGRIIALFDKKTARFFSLRKREIERVEGHFYSRCYKKDKIAWFHSASAGEFEQAKSVIEHLKKHEENVVIIASFFSPSGYNAGIKYNKIDFCFNLPLDFKRNVKRLLNCINPRIILYSKYDVWNNLTVEAHRRGIKTVLISAALPEKSFRHKFPFRGFFSKIYSLLDRIYSISESDARRFKKISCNSNYSNIRISGDTRFDRIKIIIENAHSSGNKILQKDVKSLYLVAGSTYKISEKLILNSISKLNSALHTENNLKLILVPHEIDFGNIIRLKKLVESHSFKPVLISESMKPVCIEQNEILIVDEMGSLAFLYDEADMVFVGGSFKGSVHSVLEPAIFGKAIFTGPYIYNSYEAMKLEEIGGLNTCKNEEELFNNILLLYNDINYRKKISKVSKDFFNNNTGATNFIINDIESL